MVEVRSTESAGSGVFATREYEIGSTVLEENEPMVVLAPTSKQQEDALHAVIPATASKNKKKNGKAKDDDGDVSFLSSIKVPSKIDERYHGKFRGMVQAVACFAEFCKVEDSLPSLLELYHPSLTEPNENEASIVGCAKEALKFLQNHAKGGSKVQKFVTDRPEEATKSMLVWSCNAFQGGRIYAKESRVNHSCNPNAIIKADGDKQSIVAAVAIQPGDEVTISYLGVLLYAEQRVRQEELLQMKHFRCECTRCQDGFDPAGAIPCPSCHPRQGRYLEEDVQFDDEQDVHYAIQRSSSAKAFECHVCSNKVPTVSEDPNHVTNLTQSVDRRVVSYLHDQELRNDRKDQDEALVEEEWADQLLQLAMSVAGAKHWTTNLLLLENLNRGLRGQHERMIETSEPPSMEDLAQCIDSLERICRFVQGIKLKMHMGHLLANVIIGVGRSLVSLGDTKSKKYAAEWVSKVQEFGEKFESPGIQKVIEALMVAWKQKGSNGNAEKRVSKKQRLS